MMYLFANANVLNITGHTNNDHLFIDFLDMISKQRTKNQTYLFTINITLHLYFNIIIDIVFLAIIIKSFSWIQFI